MDQRDDDFEGLDAPSPPTTAPGGAGRKALLSLSVALLFAAVLEGAASLLLAWHDSASDRVIKEEAHSRYDPDLGWSHAPNLRVDDLYGEGRHLTTNARGFRALEEYTDGVPEGRYRIVCVGDSFTLGYGVDDRQTYAAWLERLDPRLQAINMGQGGYGVDQAFLWHRRDGAELEADLVLFAFIAPDFDRMLETRFNGEYSKPLLRVVDDELVVENVPVPDDWTGSAGRRRLTHFARRLAVVELLERLLGGGAEEESEATALPYRRTAEALFRELARTCAEGNRDLVLLQLPLRDRSAGRPRQVSAWLEGLSDRLGIAFLDLTADFDALPRSELDLYYLPDGHLSPLGNRLVAEVLIRELRGLLDDFPR